MYTITGAKPLSLCTRLLTIFDFDPFAEHLGERKFICKPTDFLEFVEAFHECCQLNRLLDVDCPQLIGFRALCVGTCRRKTGRSHS